MKSHDVYRINGPEVIYENIDGELILVHMEKGAYYTTDEIGTMLWEMIASRCAVSEMREGIGAQYDATPQEIEAAIGAFIVSLESEGLVSRDDGADDRPMLRFVPSATRRPFRAPGLLSYRDMQDMLALDPIHDVEAAGWPVPKAEDDEVASRSA